jgi:hypothetical protein
MFSPSRPLGVVRHGLGLPFAPAPPAPRSAVPPGRPYSVYFLPDNLTRPLCQPSRELDGLGRSEYRRKPAIIIAVFDPDCFRVGSDFQMHGPILESNARRVPFYSSRHASPFFKASRSAHGSEEHGSYTHNGRRNRLRGVPGQSGGGGDRTRGFWVMSPACYRYTTPLKCADVLAGEATSNAGAARKSGAVAANENRHGSWALGDDSTRPEACHPKRCNLGVVVLLSGSGRTSTAVRPESNRGST